MPNALVPVSPAAPLAPAPTRAESYAAQSSSANTKRAYRSDWQHFTSWCDATGAPSLPAAPATVATYAAALADDGRAVATITRRMSSISQAHKMAGYEPTPVQTEVVRRVIKGIRRALGTAQRQAAPAVSTVLRQWVAHLPDSRLGARDRALLLVGFAGAFRRSELAGLDVADVRFVPEGMVVQLRQSKTDQEGAGESKGIPLGTSADTCPQRALRAWLKTASITEGPIFRPLNRHGHIKPKRLNGSDIATVIKRAAEAAGFDPAEFSGHSLRAGFATAAAAAGASDRAIKKQTGHKSDRALRRYIRDGALFRENAAGLVGL